MSVQVGDSFRMPNGTIVQVVALGPVILDGVEQGTMASVRHWFEGAGQWSPWAGRPFALHELEALERVKACA